MTRSEIWTICGHRLQLDMTHEQEALGTSAQVCQITEVWKDGQSPPAGYSWDSGIDQTSPEVRGEKTERKLTRPSGVEDTFLPSHWWKCDFAIQEGSLQLGASVRCMRHSDIKEHTLNCLDVSLCLMSGRFKALCEAGAFFSEMG